MPKVHSRPEFFCRCEGPRPYARRIGGLREGRPSRAGSGEPAETTRGPPRSLGAGLAGRSAEGRAGYCSMMVGPLPLVPPWLLLITRSTSRAVPARSRATPVTPRITVMNFRKSTVGAFET